MNSKRVFDATRLILLSGFLALASSGANAQSLTLRGGGSTFPIMGYMWAFSPSTSPITPAVQGSLLGVYSTASGINVSFCQDDNGYGRTVFEGNDPTNYNVNAPCQTTNGPPRGFGASGLTQPHFFATEAPLSPQDLVNYTWGHGSGTEPVQFPAAMGAIGMVFHKTGLTTLTLTEAQICGIFSGQITRWEDPALGLTVQPGPINVVFPKRSSGTTYGLMNHLTAVCPSNTLPGKVVANGFRMLPTFSDAVASYLAYYAAWTDIDAGALGSVVVDAGSDAEVAKFVQLTDGTFGFTQIANALAGNVRFANVRNWHSLVVTSPVTQFGAAPMSVTITYDVGTTDTLDLQGRPSLVSLTTTHQCIATVDPWAYADPINGYPIVAVTYLLGNRQGNGLDVPAVRQLLGMPYNTTLRASVTRMGRLATGYAWLISPDLTQLKINSCVVN